MFKILIMSLILTGCGSDPQVVENTKTLERVVVETPVKPISDTSDLDLSMFDGTTYAKTIYNIDQLRTKNTLLSAQNDLDLNYTMTGQMLMFLLVLHEDNIVGNFKEELSTLYFYGVNMMDNKDFTNIEDFIINIDKLTEDMVELITRRYIEE